MVLAELEVANRAYLRGLPADGAKRRQEDESNARDGIGKRH